LLIKPFMEGRVDFPRSLVVVEIVAPRNDKDWCKISRGSMSESVFKANSSKVNGEEGWRGFL